MTKINLNNLSTISGNETSAINLINTNNDTIETASDNTLSRDGTTPNQMLANFDMNSFRILNLVDAINLTEPPTYRQVLNLINASVGSGSLTAVLSLVVDGSGSAITTGVKGEIVIPFDCAIVGWYLLSDQVGSIQLDLWKTPYGSYPPTVANTITASSKPLISASNKNTDFSLSGWTTTISDGDTIRLNVDSVSTVTRAELILKLRKTQ